MRAVDGSGELPVASYELFSDTEVLGRMAMERMLAGLSTRRYPVGLEPVGARTEQTATATSKSAVSRRFIATTEAALAETVGRGPVWVGFGGAEARVGHPRRPIPA
jgi:putative transposase